LIVLTTAIAFKDVLMNDALLPRKALALFIVVVLAWGINWSVTKQKPYRRSGLRPSEAGSLSRALW
jgi:hypothetical protein